MLFTKVRLTGRTNIDLPFFGLRPSNTYILKSVDGLGPPEVDVFLGNGIYQGRKPQSREIVIQVGLRPNYGVGQTVSSIRNTLYGLLTPGASDAIWVKLMNGPNVVTMTQGYVKKFETVPFSKDPEVQITIACTQPYLMAPEGVTVVPATKSNFTVEYPGNVSTGMYCSVIFNDTAVGWSFFTEGQDTGPHIEIEYDFLAGDKLTVDSRPGLKAVKLDRGTTRNIIRGLTTNSIWPELHPGTNTFWSSPTNKFDWEKIVFTPLYWGI